MKTLLSIEIILNRIFGYLLNEIESREYLSEQLQIALPDTHLIRKRIYQTLIDETSKESEVDWNKVELMLQQLHTLPEEALYHAFSLSPIEEFKAMKTKIQMKALI